MVLFWKWLQETKKLSKSTSSSYVIGASSFFSYYDLDLKLRGKIPDTQMKLDINIPTLENLQTMFRLSDIQGKTLLSLMGDCPCRIGELVERVIPQMKNKEFMIESAKEGIVGKVYLSDGTLELVNQLDKAGLTLPATKRGLSLMLERVCKIAGIPAFNPQLMRKVFFTTACNLNINRDILRVLMFKSLSKDVLTYLLSREELRQAWQQIINALPLEKQVNGKIDTLKDAIDLVMKVQRKMIEKELESEVSYHRGQYMELVEKPTDRQVLERYLES